MSSLFTYPLIFFIITTTVNRFLLLMILINLIPNQDIIQLFLMARVAGMSEQDPRNRAISKSIVNPRY